MTTLLQLRSGGLHLVEYSSNDGTRHRTLCHKRYKTSDLINTFDLDSPAAIICRHCYEISEEIRSRGLNKRPPSATGKLYEHLTKKYRLIRDGNDTRICYSVITDDRFVQMISEYKEILYKHKNPKMWNKWYGR